MLEVHRYSIVGTHIKVLHWMSCLIRCVLNRCNRHDKIDTLKVLKDSVANGRDDVWLIAQFGCRGKIFHEKDGLSQFLPRKQILEGPKK